MLHPFTHLSPAHRTRLFWLLFALSLLLMGTMNTIGAPLNTSAAPAGIISFEFAATPANAQAMVASWDAPARVRAGFVQGLDFLFPVVYACALALGCLWAADALRRARWPLASLGMGLAWGMWLAALLDYIENISLVAILFGAANSPWPEIAAGCAAVKFALIFVGMVYTFFALAARLAAPRPAPV